MKRTLLDFSFCLKKKEKKKKLQQKGKRIEKEVVSAEDDGQEAKYVSLGACISVPPVWKSSKLRG